MSMHLDLDDLVFGHPTDQKELDALRKDAERYRKLQAKASQRAEYGIHGNGALWTVGVFGADRHESFATAVGKLPAAAKEMG